MKVQARKKQSLNLILYFSIPRLKTKIKN